MDVERARAFLLSLPHVVETMQWGDNLVFWAGDKRLGGKMFALANLAADAHGVIAYAAGPERFHELVEREGLRPAPYLARAHWVAADNWSVYRPREWQQELASARDLVWNKLRERTRERLALPEAEREALLKELAKRPAARAR